jgi:hypothetical protein
MHAVVVAIFKMDKPDARDVPLLKYGIVTGVPSRFRCLLVDP